MFNKDKGSKDKVLGKWRLQLDSSIVFYMKYFINYSNSLLFSIRNEHPCNILEANWRKDNNEIV